MFYHTLCIPIHQGYLIRIERNIHWAASIVIKEHSSMTFVSDIRDADLFIVLPWILCLFSRY